MKDIIWDWDLESMNEKDRNFDCLYGSAAL